MTRVLVITGPTASGKTALGVLLAKKLNGEVISADSMQVYKYMDVGTAKPTAEEMGGVPHHMISVCEPGVKYSVAEYVSEAAKVANGIAARGKTPIIVGGTGLYIESLVLGREFSGDGGDTELRERLGALYDEKGGEAMLALLAKSDPLRAAKLHPNDKKRIIRALEIAESGDTISAHDERTQAMPPRYDAKYIVLGFEDRAALYDRIDRRVDIMMERGLLGEVEALLNMGLSDSTAMQAIGYKELAAALRGECTIEEAVELIKRSSRRYAKRQISWNTRYSGALRINWEKFPNIEDAVQISTEFFRG